MGWLTTLRKAFHHCIVDPSISKLMCAMSLQHKLASAFAALLRILL